MISWDTHAYRKPTVCAWFMWGSEWTRPCWMILATCTVEISWNQNRMDNLCIFLRAVPENDFKATITFCPTNWPSVVRLPEKLDQSHIKSFPVMAHLCPGIVHHIQIGIWYTYLRHIYLFKPHSDITLNVYANCIFLHSWSHLHCSTFCACTPQDSLLCSRPYCHLKVSVMCCQLNTPKVASSPKNTYVGTSLVTCFRIPLLLSKQTLLSAQRNHFLCMHACVRACV